MRPTKVQYRPKSERKKDHHEGDERPKINALEAFHEREPAHSAHQHTLERGRTTPRSPASATVPPWGPFNRAYPPAPAPCTARGFPPPRPAAYRLPVPTRGFGDASRAGDTHRLDARLHRRTHHLVRLLASPRGAALSAPLAVRTSRRPARAAFLRVIPLSPVAHEKHAMPQLLASVPYTSPDSGAPTRPPRPVPRQGTPRVDRLQYPARNVLSPRWQRERISVAAPVGAASPPKEGRVCI